jgi:hypothetical protein
MRLFGSNTSIFSSKSTAPGDIFGNLTENCCLGNCGSCLTYLRALSLRKNPRLESSGEPMSFSQQQEKKNGVVKVNLTSNKTDQHLISTEPIHAKEKYKIEKSQDEKENLEVGGTTYNIILRNGLVYTEMYSLCQFANSKTVNNIEGNEKDLLEEDLTPQMDSLLLSIYSSRWCLFIFEKKHSFCLLQVQKTNVLTISYSNFDIPEFSYLYAISALW